jgi:hypothetical protein
LPVPTGPWKTSGLAPSPGASTTLKAEAWATRLQGPTTKSPRRCQRRLRAVFAGRVALMTVAGAGAPTWGAVLPWPQSGGGAPAQDARTAGST